MLFLLLAATAPLTAAVGVSTGTIRIGLQQVFNVGGPPVSMTTGPDNRFYICTLEGKIRVVENGAVTTALDLATAPVPFFPDGANGLYGIAFHPGFNDPASAGYRKCYTYADERKFVSGSGGPLTGLPDLWPPEKYTPGSPTPSVSNYAVATFGHFNVIREWTVNAGASPPMIDPASSRVVLRLAHPTDPGHNGSGPRFGPDGFLYVAVGDGGGSGNDYSGDINSTTDGFTNGSGNAQDRTNPFGKLLRIDPLPGATTGTLSPNGQYRIPAGNPFADGAGGNADEIYAYGFRNPWGFSWDTRTGGDGRLFLANVGSHHREEINVVTSGGNFGWGYMEGSVPLIQQDNYSGENLTAAVTFHRTPPGGFTAFSSLAPLAEYKTRRQYAPDGAATVTANLTGDGTAVTGGFVYRGTAIPALGGQYVFGDYSVSDTTPPPGFSAGQARLFYLNPAQASPSILEFIYAAGTTVPGFLLGFGQDNTGELYALFASGDVKKIVPPPTAGAPEIATAPASQTATAGDPVSFSVAANGSGPFTYQWYLNGTAIAGATAATYSIPAAQRFHAGALSVIVTNAAGSTSSNSATLTVNAAPASTARLYGLSTRGFIGINDAIMIPGLVISPGSPKTLLIRAIGPSLALPPYNVSGALTDPKITIYSGGIPILQNDDWGANPDVASTVAASLQIGAYPLAAGSKDASFVVTLPSGNYTVQATAANGTSTGIALVEVYEVP
ncbi:MAG TPA: PQQ-dependent sugar dehydrogenase [Opitutaceae bacterium]|nr:PQQ-dependent sugar dehydrogenase [Opitutaceae bacterium]